MENDKKKTKLCGVLHDKLCNEPIVWKGITFWATPDKDNPKVYKQFEVYSLKHFSTYRLVKNDIFETSHSSGWDLQKIRMGEVVPCMKISNHSYLKKATFEELFAVLSVLIDEEELFSVMLSMMDSTNGSNLLDQISKEQIIRLRKKWKLWTKDKPDWLIPTIESNNKEQ